MAELSFDERIARLELGLAALAAHVTANYPLQSGGWSPNPHPAGVDALQELHSEMLAPQEQPAELDGAV